MDQGGFRMLITLAGLLCVVCVWKTDASGVCYRRIVTRNAYTSYYVSYYSSAYYTSCGWLGWSRCRRSRSRSRASSRYHATVYGSQSFCCSGYSGSPPNCSPICNPSCVHGTCTLPSQCTCQADWTGSICRDDTNLVNWCTSITSRNIVNTHQSKVRSSLNVYCGAATSNSFVAYNSSKTAYIAPKIKADSDRSSTANRPALYELWKQHPNVRPYCCYSNTKYYITLLSSLMRYDANFYQLVGGLVSTVAVELRKELASLCSVSLSDPFCPIKAALDIIDISAKLPPNKSQWTSETENCRKAVLVHFAILKKNHPTEFASLALNEDNIIVDSTNSILKLVQEKQTAQLTKLVEYLPPNDALVSFRGVACRTNRLCIFMKIVEQVRIYVDQVSIDSNPLLINGKKRLVLNTVVDYREFLKQKQLDRILTVLSELQVTSIQIANDLKKHATTQFSELRSYFENIETFNQQIASADMGFINGRLEHYKSSANLIVNTLKADLGRLLSQTLLATGLNVAEKAVILAMEIASAFNPLKWLTGGTSGKDILVATADLANAIADVVEVKAIKSAFNTLKTKTKEIATKLEENDDFLQNVKVIIEETTFTREEFAVAKTKFVEEYTKYDPKVTKPELAEIGAYWDALVSATCDILDGLDSAAAAPIKSMLKDDGYCVELPTTTAKLISTYEEIYDYQFDLMDAMAAFVRSSVSLDAAKAINTDFQELTKLNINSATTLTTLQIMGSLTYVAFTVHVLQTVHLYCNVLEYMEGGRRPSECKGVGTNLALLVANKESVCRSLTLQFYHVPTTPNSAINETLKDYINVADLFAGKEVSFKVPSSDWLVENNWIPANERNFSFYVKRFEVYLPTWTIKPRKIVSTAIPILKNEIVPGSTEYILVPNPQMVYEYMTGPSRLYCHDPKILNPYTSCNRTQPSEICELSLYTKLHLYPSIYSQWTISAKGGEELTVPNPATNMTVILGLQLCKIAPNGYTDIINDESAVFMEEKQCCPAGQYRPSILDDCEDCPASSSSALSGYYCEKD